MSPGVRWGARLGALVLLFPAATASAPPRSAYVLGANDGRIARVDLDAGTVVPDVATAGSIPNRIETAADLSLSLIVNSGSDDVTVLDLETEAVTGTVTLPAGSNPWTAELHQGRAFVSCLFTDRVYEIDPGTLAIVDSASTGRAPEGMCVAAGKLYVANTGFDFGSFTYDPGTVTVLDLEDLSVVATVPVALNPQECLLAPDGSVHVICTGDFFLTTGSLRVIDPWVNSVVDSAEVAGYPGGGAVDDSGIVYLSVTTAAFGSELWSYDAGTLAFARDGSNPLLPTFDFLGNPAVTSGGELVVPDFSADLLLVEDPADPGTPAAYLVGDGPIDVAVVEREAPVGLALSGLAAENAAEGVRLTWRATRESDLAAFVVERRRTGEAAFTRASEELPVVREASWIDRGAEPLVAYTYRVRGVGFEGGSTWSREVTIVRRPVGGGRLAIGAPRPNPARGAVTLSLHLPRAGPVHLEVLDVRGRRVAGLEAGTHPAGTVAVVWDGIDGAGSPAAPGVYFVRARLGEEAAVARVLRVR